MNTPLSRERVCQPASHPLRPSLPRGSEARNALPASRPLEDGAAANPPFQPLGFKTERTERRRPLPLLNPEFRCRAPPDVHPLYLRPARAGQLEGGLPAHRPDRGQAGGARPPPSRLQEMALRHQRDDATAVSSALHAISLVPCRMSSLWCVFRCRSRSPAAPESCSLRCDQRGGMSVD